MSATASVQGLERRVEELEKAVGALQQRLLAEPAVLPELRQMSSDDESSFTEFEEDSGYSLKQSAWDMALLVGSSSFNTGDRVLMIFGVLVNLVLQIGFCVILMGEGWVSFAGLEGATADIRTWRYRDGHHVSNQDPVTGTSLVTRVCQGSQALANSELKGQLSESLDSYYDKNGPLLAVIVQVVYAMLVCVELRAVIDFVTAIWSVPGGPSTSVSMRDGEAKLERLSSAQRCVGTLVALVRVAVAAVLFYSGSKWLIKTVDIEGLLLNCVALGFVLEIDESVHAFFSPPKLDRLLDCLQPLQFKGSPVPWKTLRALMTVLLVILTALFLTTDLPAVMGHVDGQKDALCGGLQDFVYGLNALGEFSWAATPAKHYQSGLSVNISKARDDSIDHMIHSDWYVLTKMLHNREELLRAVSTPLSSYVKTRENCTDGSLGPKKGYLFTGDKNVDTCAAAAEYCFEAESEGLRFTCPATCGCDDPLSGQKLTAGEYGCPAVCAERALSVARNAPCKDKSPEELSSSPGWQRLVWFPSERQAGCQTFAVSYKNCTDYHVTIFCPEACGCTNRSRWLPDCPTSCMAV